MKLKLSKGYVIAEIDGKNFVVDTGATISFGYGRNGAVAINGAEYGLSPIVPRLKSTLDSITGVDVAGLIGTDILGKTNLTIDYENGELLFSLKKETAPCIDFYTIPFSLDCGQCVTDNIMINGINLKNAVIDTGAPISYVSVMVARDLEFTGKRYYDSSPIFGYINGEYRRGELTFGSMAAFLYRFPVEVGVMPDALDRMAKFDAVIGPGLLSQKLVEFDFENNFIGVALDDRSEKKQ